MTTPTPDNTPTTGSTVAEPKKKRGGCLRLILIGLGALLVLGVLASLMGGNENDTSPSSAAPSSATNEDTTEDTTEDTDSTAATAEPAVPATYKSALRQAQTYSDTMHMSKKAIYDQLTADLGGKFDADAAQYAVDNVEADWKQNALESAKTYQETMAMSPEAIRDQLTADLGGKFTKAEADYAVKNLND